MDDGSIRDPLTRTAPVMCPAAVPLAMSKTAQRSSNHIDRWKDEKAAAANSISGRQHQRQTASAAEDSSSGRPQQRLTAAAADRSSGRQHQRQTASAADSISGRQHQRQKASAADSSSGRQQQRQQTAAAAAVVAVENRTQVCARGNGLQEQQPRASGTASVPVVLPAPLGPRIASI
jgi:hypothetical protein